MPEQGNRRVVIVGAGFAGLSATRALSGESVDVTLIDRSNHHLFQPLLYQVASAALNPSDIAVPIRRILRNQKNATVLLADVKRIEPSRREVMTNQGPISYDHLVLACGATHSYFGNDHWAQHAPGLKSLDDATDIRSRILYAFEAAEREPDPTKRAAWLTFVVIGAGPTGVELAGALAEIAFRILVHDFRRIDPRDARVLLLEGRRVLPPYSEESADSARHQLESLGVEVREQTLVTGIDDAGVSIGDERIEARTVLWAAGVQASPVGASLGTETDRAGRVVVEPDLSLTGFPEVFVIGDMCRFEQDGALVPGVAPAAMQAGRHAAQNLLRRVNGQPTLPFHYVDKGSLATIGRAAAVAEVAGMHLSGLIAWLAWLGIHIFFLIGFRNRSLVLFEWAWAYLTHQRGIRLITGDVAERVRSGHADRNPTVGDERDPEDTSRVDRS